MLINFYILALQVKIHMSVDSMPYPECCRYCPHFTTTQGSCGHELRQSLIQGFADDDGPEHSCPVFDQWYAEQMAALSESLET
jgi:hypothetical protein